MKKLKKTFKSIIDHSSQKREEIHAMIRIALEIPRDHCQSRVENQLQNLRNQLL